MVVAYDASENSQNALEWVVENILREEDELHIVTIANPVAMPMGMQAMESGLPVAPVTISAGSGWEVRAAVNEAQQKAYKVAQEAQQIV